MNLQPLIADFQLSLRAALAAGLAVVFARLLQLQFPLYALISAVLVTDLAAPRTRKLALPRLAGTLVGSTLGAAINSLLPPSAWSIAPGIFVAMCLTYLLRLHDAAKVAGYVCGIILLDHSDHPWSYALFRMIETALGIGAAIIVSFVPRLIKPNKPNDSPSEGRAR